ncbi:MAG: O-antigen ligase family protein [bacterium]
MLVSLVSIVALSLRVPLFTQELDGQLLPTGTFGYANAFAGFLLLTMASTAALFTGLPGSETGHSGGMEQLLGRHKHLLLGGMLAPQVAAMVLTRARAVLALLAFLVVCVLILQTLGTHGVAGGSRRWRFGFVVLLIAGLLAGGMLIWREVAPQMAVSGLPAPTTQTGTALASQDIVPMTSDAFRIKTWMAAVKAMRERPVLGYGLDTFYQAYSPFKLGGRTAYAHDLLVQQLVELGAVGAILLAGFVVMVAVRPARRILTGSLTQPQVPLLLGLQAFLLQNLVDLSWYFPALFMVFSLLCGVMLSYYRPRDAPSSPLQIRPD